jgi:multidrug efflux pump
MFISDLSVTRPVFATVVSSLLVLFGLVAFERLSLREYPDIDPPIVSIDTRYRGAAAAVVETRITQLIEDRVAGIEGIRSINSTSQDGRSRISVEFNLSRDIDSAANDIRDRVFSVLSELPAEADPPEVSKADSDDEVIMWLNLVSKKLTVAELTDYAERYLVDRFSVLNGVARVRLGGGQRYAMRIWLDRTELAARNITVAEVENALRAENIELPAGSIESTQVQFSVRVERAFRNVDDFKSLVLGRSSDGYLIRLADVARVELGSEEDRSLFRGNTVPMLGIGIIKQSTANTIDVARAANRLADEINTSLPEGTQIVKSYDSSVFVERAISEVYFTLLVAILLVVLVIFFFLGSLRALIVPAITVPVSLVATFIVLYAAGFSVNLLTLLALVLAIGLVVDDAIVVLENIFRRMQKFGEPALLAAFNGTREVGFAVVATTVVLVAVFVPLAFLEGDIGRLFLEFSLTLAAAVCFSSFVALSLSPVIAAKVLSVNEKNNSFSTSVKHMLEKLQNYYRIFLGWSLARPKIAILPVIIVLLVIFSLFKFLPSEYAPAEDRGAFFITVSGPEGASYSYMLDYMNEIERRLMPMVQRAEINRLLVRAPGFGSAESFNSGRVIVVLQEWGSRRSAFAIMDEVRRTLADLPGVRTGVLMRRGFGGGGRNPVQFVIGGGTYAELAAWRDILLQEIDRNNPGLSALDWDYKETKPQIEVVVDYNRAAELGVSVQAIGRTLETMLGSRRVTTFIKAGEEYDVLLEGERDAQRTSVDIENIYVRSARSNQLISLSNLVTLREVAQSTTLARYNRVRSITIQAGLTDGLTLGRALGFLENLAKEHLPEEALISYKGESRDFKETGRSMTFVFLLGIITVFLVLAAQFESFVHPLVIIFCVPLAILGGLLGILAFGGSLNVYSQIALIMLVGLAGKNGILIVEFANQLRERGMSFHEALIEASVTRLRPIVMTAITTAAGSLPLVLSSGAGAESRQQIGMVVMCGVVLGTVFTLWLIPVAYQSLAQNTGFPGSTRQMLEKEKADRKNS